MEVIHIGFKVLVFYKTDDALEQYIKRFRFVSPESLLYSRNNERLYLGDGVQVLCIRGLGENTHGRRADFVAVQEELTWGDAWIEIRDDILYPCYAVQSPFRFLMGFPIQQVNFKPTRLEEVVGGTA